jgi:FkbM family methyltransferase
MQVDLTHRQRELIHKLSHAVVWSKRHRMLRSAKDPLKVLQMRYLRAAKKTRKVRVRTFWGGGMDIIFPERVSQFIWRHGYFEADVCLFMITLVKPGMTFVDVGAHFGFFTLLAAHLVGQEGRIIALEPTCRTYAHLKENVDAYCACPNVCISNLAAYSDNGWANFRDCGLQDSAFNSMFGSRDTPNPSSSATEIRVQTRRIDDMLTAGQITNVDLIKIDAESCEMHVLAGLERTLQSCKPAVIMEVGDLGIPEVPTSRQLIEHLQQFGYTPFEAKEGEIVAHTVQDKYEYGNLLFVHGDSCQGSAKEYPNEKA